MTLKRQGLLIITTVTILTLVTTPLSAWHEHIAHFLALGGLLLLYLVFCWYRPASVVWSKRSFFALLLVALFLISHALPCHLLVLPNHSLSVTSVQHPCCMALTTSPLISPLLQTRLFSAWLLLLAYTVPAILFVTRLTNKSPPAFAVS